MAEGLKAMAVEGHGVAFLPHSAVKKELRARRLVSALPADMSTLQLTMEVRAYRERPSSGEGHRATTVNGKPVATNGKTKANNHRNNNQALWDYLLSASTATT